MPVVYLAVPWHPWQRRFRDLLPGSGAPEYKNSYSRNIFWGSQNKSFGFLKCLLIFENPQKPNYMLQIPGKNTEAKFFWRKTQKLKHSAADDFFWILEDLGMFLKFFVGGWPWGKFSEAAPQNTWERSRIFFGEADFKYSSRKQSPKTLGNVPECFPGGGWL